MINMINNTNTGKAKSFLEVLVKIVVAQSLNLHYGQKTKYDYVFLTGFCAQLSKCERILQGLMLCWWLQ